jgi:hypothetical protein
MSTIRGDGEGTEALTLKFSLIDGLPGCAVLPRMLSSRWIETAAANLSKFIFNRELSGFAVLPRGGDHPPDGDRTRQSLKVYFL